MSSHCCGNGAVLLVSTVKAVNRQEHETWDDVWTGVLSTGCLWPTIVPMPRPVWPLRCTLANAKALVLLPAGQLQSWPPTDDHGVAVLP